MGAIVTGTRLNDAWALVPPSLFLALPTSLLMLTGTSNTSNLSGFTQQQAIEKLLSFLLPT
jgi:hypothetical protein